MLGGDEDSNQSSGSMWIQCGGLAKGSSASSPLVEIYRGFYHDPSLPDDMRKASPPKSLPQRVHLESQDRALGPLLMLCPDQPDERAITVAGIERIIRLKMKYDMQFPILSRLSVVEQLIVMTPTHMHPIYFVLYFIRSTFALRQK